MRYIGRWQWWVCAVLFGTAMVAFGVPLFSRWHWFGCVAFLLGGIDNIVSDWLDAHPAKPGAAAPEEAAK